MGTFAPHLKYHPELRGPNRRSVTGFCRAIRRDGQPCMQPPTKASGRTFCRHHDRQHLRRQATMKVRGSRQRAAQIKAQARLLWRDLGLAWAGRPWMDLLDVAPIQFDAASDRVMRDDILAAGIDPDRLASLTEYMCRRRFRAAYFAEDPQLWQAWLHNDLPRVVRKNGDRPQPVDDITPAQRALLLLHPQRRVFSINNPPPKRRRGSAIQVPRAMRARVDDMPRDPEAERLARELRCDYATAKRHVDDIRRSTKAIWGV